MESRKHYDPYRKILLDPREEIVISGISGRFPESNNLYELRDNLMNKVDLITDDNRRWKLDHPEIPQRTGKLNSIEKFDAEYFDYDFKQAHTTDPQGRMLLEHSYEAIVDAGMNPKQLRGTKTGVFVGACFSESEMTWVYEKFQGDGYGTIGCCRAMLANRVSQWLGVKGTSYNVDSACSASLFAMEHAYAALRSCICDYALVGGANLCLHPNVSFQFARLGVLSLDGRSKAFDNAANGYVRGETVSVAFLQKAETAKRIYATVVHAKTNCDGFKTQGITFPSSELQKALLKSFYEECKISPRSLAYIEAHGTGTAVGDPEELEAVDAIFCTGKMEPLKIGSVKSNLGHGEAASGLAQIAKIIVAIETGVIPPNLHYKTPREGVKGLKNGNLKVVTEPTPWDGGYVGASAFGFGGANAHVLLKTNPKQKMDGGKPHDNLPRLILASGRTEEAVNAILSDVENRPVDVEYIRLLHNLYAEDFPGHPYRGYTICDTLHPEKRLREITSFSRLERPIWFVFSRLDFQWASIGNSLCAFPVFAEAIRRCNAALKPHNIDIHIILTDGDGLTDDNTSIVGMVAVQIGLVDVLRSLEIAPDRIIGQSIGELSGAYADGCLTAHQTILIAYFLALTLSESQTIQGAMSTDNLRYEMLQHRQSDMEVVWHNSSDGSDIGAPQKLVKPFMATLTSLKTETISRRDIDHYSQCVISNIRAKLFERLAKIIPEPKFSRKFLSASVEESRWYLREAGLCSAEYFSHKFLDPVAPTEKSAPISKEAVIIQFSPRELLKGLLEKSLSCDKSSISLVSNRCEDNAKVFLQSIGRLYEIGLQPAIWKLYPEVKFPVSRGTPMISPLVKWDHSDDWFVTSYQQQMKITSGKRIVDMTLSDEEYEYLSGHVIDGRNLVPATGYLALIWETVSMLRGLLCTEVPIIFENVSFLRATTISKESAKLTLMIQRGTGRFEIIEGDIAVVTGLVRDTADAQMELVKFPTVPENEPEELDAQDVYKELRLRGYQYSGQFKAIRSTTLCGTKGTIRWHNNWVAFMDNMLQMMLLGRDTRSLFVPTAIQKLVIDTKEHSRQIRALGCDEQELKVYVSHKYNIISSGGIQVRGLRASAISRRKGRCEPILETYQFVTHRDSVDTSFEDAIRLAIQLALENQLSLKIKTLEWLNTGEQYSEDQLLSYHIAKTLTNLPLVQPDVNIVTSGKNFDEELSQNIKVIGLNNLTTVSNTLILSGRNILVPEKSATLPRLLSTVKADGFVIALESSSTESLEGTANKLGLNIIFEKFVTGSTFLLLRKIYKTPKITSVIQVKNSDFTWVEDLKRLLKADVDHEHTEPSRILLTSNTSYDNGLLGLINCLRLEPGGRHVRALLIQDTNAPEFSLSTPLYADQLKFDLVINVLGPKATWGSYRHLPLAPYVPRPVHHIWAMQHAKGDLTSFRWLEGPITSDFRDSQIIKVVYSSLNFKDIMLATGKLTAENLVESKLTDECILGMEYSGITASGSRIMGLTNSHALTNILACSPTLTWPIPDTWTLEQAATVPCVYATCVYALYIRGKMKKGDKILIHAGSGGVGQAAITLALWTGCEIFTTASTQKKRAFIRSTFPLIPADHIGNSRDTSFEQMVMEKTHGKGVDIVLNSLAEEKLQASVRCLAQSGKFLEIGKFDMANNSLLGMSIFLKGISFYSILLENIITSSAKLKGKLEALMQNLLNDRAIKPLNATVFSRDEIESAFRYMAAGKHIGKVILRIQNEESIAPQFTALPRYYCRPNRCYLILGGLGGFGLELADWLILRGARHLILASRSGITKGYQRLRIKTWKEYGVHVTIISGKNAANSKDCEEILSLAAHQAPIDGIFNLAVVLKDNLFENQSAETFQATFEPKAWSTNNLDKISRRLCPGLRHFVFFSSMSCGRGNTGQTNYGMSNSVMERVCERRVADGFPALAIQWGAIGDVGLLEGMEDGNKKAVVGGTLRQSISSCLGQLDGFLNQSSPVVVSMVVAGKKIGDSGSLNIVDTVLKIMSLKDLKSVRIQTPLVEFGMDSMMALEIKQTLEREFEIFLTTQDIRSLNFAKLIEFNSKDTDQQKKTAQITEVEVATGITLLVNLAGNPDTIDQVYLELPTKGSNEFSEVFLIPGVEGCGNVFEQLAKDFTCPATCLQFGINDTEYRSIQDMALQLQRHILQRASGRKHMMLIGYSFGTIVAIEVARILEMDGITCILILIDGSAAWLKEVMNQQIPSANNDELETNILIGITNLALPKLSAELRANLQKCKSWEEKLDVMMERTAKENLGSSIESRKRLCTCIYRRLVALDNYDTVSLPPIQSPIILLKSTHSSVKDLPEDYGLGEITNGKVDAHFVEGNHLTILLNPEVARIINEHYSTIAERHDLIGG